MVEVSFLQHFANFTGANLRLQLFLFFVVVQVVLVALVMAPGAKAETDATDLENAGSGTSTGTGYSGLASSSFFFFPPRPNRRNSLGGSGSTWCDALRSRSFSTSVSCSGLSGSVLCGVIQSATTSVDGCPIVLCSP
jgi:hypothetical protein